MLLYLLYLVEMKITLQPTKPYTDQDFITHREVKFAKIDGYETKLMMHDEVIIPYDRSNKKYIYFYGSTTNIMSYGTLNKFTTWHWQWLIINPNLRTFNL